MFLIEVLKDRAMLAFPMFLLSYANMAIAEFNIQIGVARIYT